VVSEGEAPAEQADGESGARDGAADDAVVGGNAPSSSDTGETDDQFGGNAGEGEGQVAPETDGTGIDSVAGGNEQTAADRVDEGGLSGWQIAQIALGAALVGLVVVLIAVQRLASHVRRLDPGF
jgi:hypothetical protein